MASHARAMATGLSFRPRPCLGVADCLVRSAHGGEGFHSVFTIVPDGALVDCEEVQDVLVPAGHQQRAEADRGAVKVPSNVWVRVEGQSADSDQPVCPSCGNLRRRAQVSPVIPERLDVRNLVRLIGVPQALEPAVTSPWRPRVRRR